MYSASPKAKRVEFRPPDPSANPYLAFAALLMAGLDGVLNKIEPGDPLDKDIYDLTPEEMKSVPSMPGSLEEALNCLEDDHQFLLKGDVFTEELIETFIDYKRRNEADAVRLRPHPYEFSLILRYLKRDATIVRKVSIQFQGVLEQANFLKFAQPNTLISAKTAQLPSMAAIGTTRNPAYSTRWPRTNAAKIPPDIVNPNSLLKYPG